MNITSASQVMIGMACMINIAGRNMSYNVSFSPIKNPKKTPNMTVINITIPTFASVVPKASHVLCWESSLKIVPITLAGLGNIKSEEIIKETTAQMSNIAINPITYFTPVSICHLLCSSLNI